MNTNLTILYSIYMGKYRVYKASQQKQWFGWCASHTKPVSRDLGTYILLCIWAKKTWLFFRCCSPQKQSPKIRKVYLLLFHYHTRKALKSKWTRGLMWIFTLVDLDSRKKGYIHENGSGKSPRRRKVCFLLRKSLRVDQPTTL